MTVDDRLATPNHDRDIIRPNTARPADIATGGMHRVTGQQVFQVLTVQLNGDRWLSALGYVDTDVIQCCGSRVDSIRRTHQRP